MLRRAARALLPAGVVEAPKRPVQTPQREWLRNELRDWATSCIEQALQAVGGGWLRRETVRREWDRFCQGAGDNSYYIWQWISIGMIMTDTATNRTTDAARSMALARHS